MPFYVIVDRLSSSGQPRLLACRAGEQGYVGLRPATEGWLELEPIGLWLAFEEGRLAARNAQGRCLRDYQEVMREMQVGDMRAREALTQMQGDAQARQQAEALAQTEAKACQEAEARAQAAEERIRTVRS